MNDPVRYGYYWSTSPYDPALGHAGIDVYVTESPQSERFFDARAALFSIYDNNEIRQIGISHPTHVGQRRYQLVFGRFYLVAHDDDVVTGMCFGGELLVENSGDYSHCYVHSSAPLFELDDNDDLFSVLEAEVEVELARLRAQWHGSDEEFEARLAKLDPLTFFVISLDMVHTYLNTPAQEVSGSFKSAQARVQVHKAIETLQAAGQWPAVVSSLREAMGE